MTPWTIGLSTGCFYQKPIGTVLHDIKSAGFDVIEICSFPRHLDYHDKEAVQAAGGLIRELGMRPVSFHAPFAERIDITSPDPVIRSEAVQELVTACEAAAAMGVENIVLHPGPEHSGRPPEEEFLTRMRNATESLNTVATHCCVLGIRLVLENMLPHLLFGHTNDMMYLLGSIKTCETSTCLDTGHAFLGGEMGQVIHRLSGHLHLVHANDNNGGRDDHLPPGEGKINWPWVLGELHRHHFQGTLILELSSRENESADSMLERAGRGREYLIKLMHQMRD